MRKLVWLLMAVCVLGTDVAYADLNQPESQEENSEYRLRWESNMGEYQIWTDGAEVRTDYSDGALVVTVDARTSSGQEYYTAFIYNTGSFDWSDYGELVFELENMSSEPLRLNFVLTDANQEEYVVNEEMPILLIAEDSSIMELRLSQWGAVEIPSGFKGTVRVPDYHLSNLTLANIISFGLSITVPQNVSQSFSLSNVRLIQLERMLDTYGFDIYGDTEIQVPFLGEAISRYTVVFHGIHQSRESSTQTISENVVFRLDKEIEGVSITEDGLLVVEENAGDYNFNIYADINEQVRRFLPIELFERGGHVPLPRQNEVERLQTDEDMFFDTNILQIIRYIGLSLVAFLCGLFFSWRIWWLKRGAHRHEEGIY